MLSNEQIEIFKMRQKAVMQRRAQYMKREPSMSFSDALHHAYTDIAHSCDMSVSEFKKQQMTAMSLMKPPQRKRRKTRKTNKAVQSSNHLVLTSTKEGAGFRSTNVVSPDSQQMTWTGNGSWGYVQNIKPKQLELDFETKVQIYNTVKSMQEALDKIIEILRK